MNPSVHHSSTQPSLSSEAKLDRVRQQFRASAEHRRKLGHVVPAEPYFVSPEVRERFRQKHGSNCFLH
jgi:hypothetical protein